MAEKHQCSVCGRSIGFEGVCYECRNRQARNTYQAMTPGEVEAMQDEILREIKTIQDWGKVYKDFMSLLACKDINTARIAEAAFASQIYYPPELYRNASPAVRDGLIELLMQPDCGSANNILVCLAVQGDEKVLEVFKKLEANPQPWRKNLYVDPSRYAHSGGWTFDSSGQRHELVYQQCYTMQEGEPDSAARIGQPRDEKCHSCGGTLVDILTLDGRDQRLVFLGLGGVVRIPICPNCATMCETTIVRYTPDGDSTMELVEPFAEDNYITDKELAELAANKLALSASTVPPYYSHGLSADVTIGGYPSWVQDAQYESCPDCGKTMRFMAALPWDALMDYSEGTLYIEVCTDCRVMALVHQQT